MDGNKLTILPRDFYQRPAKKVAEDLLGKLLVRREENNLLIGKINETEAYLGEHDPAAHVAKGKTKRTQVIYGEAGHAYIYTIHGHQALNVVCEWVDSPGSVLIRGLEVIQGINLPTHGPGRLTKAMQITKDMYGVDLTTETSELYICEGEKVDKKYVLVTPRVGVRGAKDWLLRFVYRKD
jgi:DNA-3-methyladenine glycosylase